MLKKTKMNILDGKLFFAIKSNGSFKEKLSYLFFKKSYSDKIGIYTLPVFNKMPAQIEKGKADGIIV